MIALHKYCHLQKGCGLQRNTPQKATTSQSFHPYVDQSMDHSEPPTCQANQGPNRMAKLTPLHIIMTWLKRGSCKTPMVHDQNGCKLDCLTWIWIPPPKIVMDSDSKITGCQLRFNMHRLGNNEYMYIPCSQNKKRVNLTLKKAPLLHTYEVF